MPAAAVIPAPEAYIKVVAVKKLVVGFLVDQDGPVLQRTECRHVFTILRVSCAYLSRGRAPRPRSFTLKKLECFRQAYASEYISME